MGFYELGRNLSKNNDRLRAGLRRKFKIKDFVSPPFKDNRVELKRNKTNQNERCFEIIENQKKKKVALQILFVVGICLVVAYFLIKKIYDV